MPFLTNIGIAHYRGFYASRTIAPAIPNGKAGSGLTVLVGPNNSGKSTVVSAIRFVAGGPRQVDVEHRHPEDALVLSLENGLGETKTLTNPDLGAVTVIQGNEKAFPTTEDVRLVPSRRAWSAYTSTARMEQHDYWRRQIVIDEQDTFLVSRLACLSADDRERFSKLLKELLPQLSAWRIELSRGQTFIQYETEAGARHAADLFGDGMASIFRVALSLFDSSVNQIVVIDEPELSLHPQAQKLLASVLSRFASDRQIIVTTHSPYFVNWSDLTNGGRIYRLTQKKDGVAIGSLASRTLHRINKLIADWQKPNLLDEVAREVFFADEVVFLEGQEDVGLLRRFGVDRGLPPLAVFGYGAGGAGNIRHFLRMAADLGIPAAAIFDGDHEEDQVMAAEEFPDWKIELLPTDDIRDKPKKDASGKEIAEIEKEGIFDRQGKIKPEYEPYLAELLRTISTALRSAH
jgi:ABC-type uncharacterized transport system ATPase subunit